MTVPPPLSRLWLGLPLILALFGCSSATRNAAEFSLAAPTIRTARTGYVGLEIVVLTYNGARPALPGSRGDGPIADPAAQLADWSEASVRSWIAANFETRFLRDPSLPPGPTNGVRIDPAQSTVWFYEQPGLFDIDTKADADALMNLVIRHDPRKITLYLLNSSPWFHMLGYARSSSCMANGKRGAWVGTTDGGVKTIAHELGHLMGLPHVVEDNLMSYGPSLSLSEAATTVTHDSCAVFGAPVLNQYASVWEWSTHYL